MSNVHIILQGKGGVGKSMIASMLAQYKNSHNEQPICIDSDPVNSTFAGYQALDVQRVHIMDEDEINTRNFDTLVEIIANSNGTDVIIDNGASSFVPLTHYLISNEVPSLIKELGYEPVIHTVIAGGQSLHDTVSGFSQLVKQWHGNDSFVVWLNPYFGSIEFQGKTFYQMKAYLDNKDRISALIDIPNLKSETYGQDLSEILQSKLTFQEALADTSLTIMHRQRLKIIRDRFFNQLDTVSVL